MPHHSINRVVLVGRLTRDPELRATPAGTSVCSLRIACNAYRREPDGSYGERPSFFDVSVFGTAAENVDRYTHRGMRVAIDGRLDWREWETAEGQRRQSVGIVADNVEFLDSGRGGEGGGDEPDEGELAGVGAGDDGLEL
jgi:single-strand DNA-binding protein